MPCGRYSITKPHTVVQICPHCAFHNSSQFRTVLSVQYTYSTVCPLSHLKEREREERNKEPVRNEFVTHFLNQKERCYHSESDHSTAKREKRMLSKACQGFNFSSRYRSTFG